MLQYLITNIYRIILKTIDFIFLKVSDAAEEMKIADMDDMDKLTHSFYRLTIHMQFAGVRTLN